MIAVDWGTSSFRALLLDTSGVVRARQEGPYGILSVPEGGFADRLGAAIAPWLEADERLIWMCGMVGSRQGWVEVPYLPCPAGPAELARAARIVPFEGAQLRLVPGMIVEGDRPDVMRGEETQIVGVLDQIEDGATICLPGTHGKWATVRDGRIAGFATHMTGEAFAVLRSHSILGRLMEQDAPHDAEAFARGVARAAEPGGLLHHLFGVRALGLTGGLTPANSAAYLSGLLIGHELTAALAEAPVLVHLVGGAGLTALYAAALEARGVPTRIHDADAAARGLFRMAQS